MPSLKGDSLEPPPKKPVRSLDLTRFRQKGDVSLEQIAERTKISIRFLRAIEAEDFGQLPGGIFAYSYLRQYAQATGVDAERLIRHYDASVNPVATVEESPRRSRRAETRTILGRLFGIPA